MSAVRARAVALPRWFWLTTIVVVSILVRLALAHRIVAPWIMVDEIVYSELAKSFAAHGSFLVRGVPSRGYGIVYPIVIAPAWRLFGSIPTVYTAAKAINCVVMSLAAVPAYFLARRLLPAALALAVAVLAVLVPEMLYTGMMMTENVFYPVFLTLALLLQATLERPTLRRQLGLLALFVLAYETRAQAVALLAAIATAPLLYALVRRQGLRGGLRAFLPLYGILAGGALVAILATVARGRSPLTLLGAYDAATTSTYTVSGVAHFLLYHVALLDLSLGVVPFAALLAIWLSPRRDDAPRAAFAAGSFAISLWLLAEVAAFASQTSVDRIEERNMFYLAPFGFVALLALAREGLVPRRGRALLAAALIAGVLPVFIPFTRFITTSAVSDTFALLPWWWVQDHWITIQQVRWAALGAALAVTALFVALPRRYALVFPALVAAYLVATTAVVANGRHGIELDSQNSLFSGTHFDATPDWIDRTVGAHASVGYLWVGDTNQSYTVWENEFFNRSVGTVYDLDNAVRPDPLPETPATRTSDGRLLDAGRPIRVQYMLVSSTLRLRGSVVASDPVGIDLYRVDGPLVELPPPRIRGIYPGNTWSGRRVTYALPDCGGGTLDVALQSDGSLFRVSQTVTAFEGGRAVAHVSFSPTSLATLAVPLRPDAAHACDVRFAVARTAIPAEVEANSTDTRRLGTHFNLFTYLPPRLPPRRGAR